MTRRIAKHTFHLYGIGRAAARVEALALGCTTYPPIDRRDYSPLGRGLKPLSGVDFEGTGSHEVRGFEPPQVHSIGH